MNPTMVLILIMTSFGLAACSRPVEVNMLSGKAQGTTWHVSVWSKKPVNTVQLQADIETEFARIDKVMSNYRPDSVIEQFNDNGTSDAIDIGKKYGIQWVDDAVNDLRTGAARGAVQGMQQDQQPEQRQSPYIELRGMAER